MKLLASLASLALVLGWHATAEAVPVIGDQSSVTLVLDTGSLGIGVTGTGSTTVDPLGRYALPITGGDVTLSPLSGSIQHAGSGITLTRDTLSLSFSNLVIDFGTGIVTGDVGGTGQTGSFDLFDLVDCNTMACIDENGAIPVTESGLFLRTNGANLVNGLFPGPVVSAGDQIGLADIRLRLEDGNSVPEPGMMLLLGAGLAGVGFVRRRAA